MSSGGIYQTSWAMQAEAASSVSTAIATLDAELADLNTQVQNLVGTWDSDAQQAYYARQQQWNSASDNIKQALQQFVSGLNTSADTASSAESRNVNVVSG
jgi:early secretory antigenic target protein ESAT-6